MKLVMNFDGSVIPENPGKTTVGAFLVKNDKGELLHKENLLEEHDEITSCNYAEYKGLELGIEWIKKNKDMISEIKIVGDSQMVIRQMKGQYKIKPGKLYSEIAFRVVKTLFESGLKEDVKMSFEWVPREMNEEADALTK